MLSGTHTIPISLGSHSYDWSKGSHYWGLPENPTDVFVGGGASQDTTVLFARFTRHKW